METGTIYVEDGFYEVFLSFKPVGYNVNPYPKVTSQTL